MRFLTNPTFSIETGQLLSHDGEEFLSPLILFDRSVAKKAGQAAGTATGVGSEYGAGAGQISSSLIPGLETQANTPTGFTPIDKARMLTSAGEAAGGANAGAGGVAQLTSLRTSTPGGFAGALGEAARAKGRTMSEATLGVNLADARLREQKRAEAQRLLSGLYGTDVNAQLRAMGLVPEDINAELAAKRQGGLQNFEGLIGTLSGAGKAAFGKAGDAGFMT
jgi:hypothetical protein